MRKLIKLAKTHYLLLVFAFFYLIYAFLAYKHIPIANGEEFRYLRGKETLEHLTKGDFKEKLVQPRPHYFIYNGYTALQNALNPNFYYEWFHLQNLLFGLTIFFAVYVFAYYYSKSAKVGFFALLALTLFPTFFGQLGFNPIDMPFTVFFMFGLLAIYCYSEKELKPWQLLVMGFVFGVAQSLRQLGFSLYILLFLYQLFLKTKDKQITFNKIVAVAKENFISYVMIFVIAGFVMLLTWPNLAINPFKGFWWHLFVGQNFYLWDYGLLFMGEFLTNPERPIYYLPLLQLITSPIYITLGFLLVFKYFKRLITNNIYFLLIIAFIINYSLYFILDPVLYDGTRHFLFLVPIAVLISTFNIVELLKTKKVGVGIKKVARIVILVSMVIVGHKMVSTFPHNYVFFNPLADAFGNPHYVFESDYSSTTYKDAAQWVRDEYLKNYAGEKLLKVYSCDNGFAVDYYSHKTFETTIKREEADLIICDYKTLLRNDYGGELLHEVSLNGVPVTFVYQMR